MTVEAESLDDALRETRLVIRAYLEDLREAGQPIPTDDVTVTSLTVAA